MKEGSQLIVSYAVREAAGNGVGEALPLGPLPVRGYAGADTFR
jgi:hypothetical protein